MGGYEMAKYRIRLSDQQAEQLVGRILQIGVVAAALVVSAGGAVYLRGTEGRRPTTASFRASLNDSATSWKSPARPLASAAGV